MRIFDVFIADHTLFVFALYGGGSVGSRGVLECVLMGFVYGWRNDRYRVSCWSQHLHGDESNRQVLRIQCC